MAGAATTRAILSPQHARCALAWGVPLLLVVLLLAAVVLPWWQRSAQLDQRLVRVRDQIADYRSVIATLPQLQLALEQVRNREDVKAFYFSADTPALAGAQLQTQVQQMIRASAARPVSTQLLPVDESEQPPRIRVRVQFQGTTEATLAVLYAIEAARPFLFIDQMSLRSAASNVQRREMPARAGRPIVQARERDELTVRLDIFGFSTGAGA